MLHHEIAYFLPVPTPRPAICSLLSQLDASRCGFVVSFHRFHVSVWQLGTSRCVFAVRIIYLCRQPFTYACLNITFITDSCCAGRGN